MAYIIQNDVHVAVEITDLYYEIINKEEIDKKASLLPMMGIDKENFEKKEVKPIRKYIEVFKSKAPYINQASTHMYFKAINQNINGDCLAHIMLESKDLEELKGYKEDLLTKEDREVRERLAKNIAITFEDDMDTEAYKLLIDPMTRIDYLEKQELNLETKWHIMLIIEKPKEWLLKLIEVILESAEAYEIASKHIIKLKEKFLEELRKNLERNPQYIKEAIGIGLEEYDMKLYPLIVAYGSGRFKLHSKEGGMAFLGCYFSYIAELAEKNNTTKLEVVNVMKILGESSKFEILQLLKKRPMYGTELAERLGITPPTVSHHINNLIVYKLVKFEKIDGRFYYVFNEEKVKEILNEIRKQLLE